MNLFTRLLLISTFLFISFNAISYGQEAEETKEASESVLSFNLGADFVSRYVWRGNEQDAVPHIQPYGSIDLSLSEKSSLSLGVWGSYGFTGGFAENDFSLSYSYESNFGNITAMVTDFYYPFLGIPFSNFTNDTLGAHTVEAALSYTGNESIPIRLQVSQNIHGVDHGSKSFYVEAGFFAKVNNVDVDVFVGAAKGVSAWYLVETDKIELINTGISLSKEIKVTEDYSIPAGVSFVYNPHHKVSYLIFKVSL